MHCEIHISRLANLIKNILHAPWNDAVQRFIIRCAENNILDFEQMFPILYLLIGSAHCVCLAGSGLSVGKDSYVESSEQLLLNNLLD